MEINGSESLFSDFDFGRDLQDCVPQLSGNDRQHSEQCWALVVASSLYYLLTTNTPTDHLFRQWILLGGRFV